MTRKRQWHLVEHPTKRTKENGRWSLLVSPQGGQYEIAILADSWGTVQPIVEKLNALTTMRDALRDLVEYDLRMEEQAGWPGDDEGVRLRTNAAALVDKFK